MHSKTTFQHPATGAWSCATVHALLSLWLSMATETTIGFQTRRTATHDAPWSLLLCFTLLVVFML